MDALIELSNNVLIYFIDCPENPNTVKSLHCLNFAYSVSETMNRGPAFVILRPYFWKRSESKNKKFESTKYFTSFFILNKKKTCWYFSESFRFYNQGTNFS